MTSYPFAALWMSLLWHLTHLLPFGCHYYDILPICCPMDVTTMTSYPFAALWMSLLWHLIHLLPFFLSNSCPLDVTTIMPYRFAAFGHHCHDILSIHCPLSITTMTSYLFDALWTSVLWHLITLCCSLDITADISPIPHPLHVTATTSLAKCSLCKTKDATLVQRNMMPCLEFYFSCILI